jgi:hypothetical protein
MIDMMNKKHEHEAPKLLYPKKKRSKGHGDFGGRFAHDIIYHEQPLVFINCAKP